MSTMQWATASSFPVVYEELSVPGFFAAFADVLLDRADLRSGERLLDVATGTGIVLRRARERCPDLGRTTGLDITPAMLEVAREKSGGVEIEYVEGDATAMPFAEDSFDVLTCQQGLQFFPDRDLGVREFHRVLARGGRAVVACWAEIDAAPGYRAVAEAISQQLPQLVGAAKNPFSLSDPDELRRLIESAGFKEVTVERIQGEARFASADEFTRSYVAGSPLAIPLAAEAEQTRKALAADITARIRQLGGDGPVALPLTTNIALAQKG